jgi:hypothetical protein
MRPDGTDVFIRTSGIARQTASKQVRIHASGSNQGYFKTNSIQYGMKDATGWPAFTAGWKR